MEVGLVEELKMESVIHRDILIETPKFCAT